MSTRTWVIVVIIAILGVCALCLGVAGIGWLLFSSGRINTVSVFPEQANVQASAEEQIEFFVATPASLEVRNAFGDIDVVADEGADGIIRVTMTKTGYGPDVQQAEAALDRIEVIVDERENGVSLRVVEQDGVNYRPASVSFSIRVPVETAVVLDTNAGRLRLEGTSGKADLRSQFGEVWVSDVVGGLAVRTAAGRIEARRVMRLPSGEGDISLNTDFGEVLLEDAQGGRVDLSTRSGRVQMTNVQSDETVAIDSQFGEFTWARGSAGDVRVNAGSGSVRLNDLLVDGALSVTTTFGEIHLSGVEAGSYDLNSASGMIEADGVRGDVKAHSSQNEVRITGGEAANLDLFSRSGMITYRGELGDGPHNLETDFGEIVLRLPSSSAFDLDLRTRFGSLESDFEIDYEIDEQQHWVGTVNGGGSQVRVETMNGSIRLETTP